MNRMTGDVADAIVCFLLERNAVRFAVFRYRAGFLLLGMIPNLWDAVRMRDWVQVPVAVYRDRRAAPDPGNLPGGQRPAGHRREAGIDRRARDTRPAYTRHAAADDITGIGKSIGMQTRQGNRAQAYYRIHARTRDGRRTALGEGLTGASRVDALIEQLRAALGLSGQANEPEPAVPRFGRTRLSVSQPAAGAGQPQSKRLRWLLNAGSFALFLVFVLWNFRDIIFS